MKRILAVILWLAFSTSAMAGTATLSWDPMPAGQAWTAVRAYEVTGAIPNQVYTLVGSTPVVGTPPPANSLVLANVPTGTHTYTVRSYNGQSESANSNTATGIILATPTAPTTITITIVVP